jgi:AAA domain
MAGISPPPLNVGPGVSISRVRSDRGVLVGTTVVRRRDGQILYDGDLRLRSVSDQSALVRFLRDVDPSEQWGALVAIQMSQAIAGSRASLGAAVRELREATDDEQPWIIPGFAHSVEPTTLFADGGGFKSWLALAIAVAVHTGQPCLGFTPTARRRVLYLDWELDGPAHKQRLRRMVGDYMPDLLYRRCSLPLPLEAAELGDVVEQRQVGFLVIDSAGPACDGAPEAADVAMRFYETLRADLRVPAIVLAHTTKAGESHRPFGSAYWHNLTRSSWYVESNPSPDAGGADLVLRHRKNTFGPRMAPVGLRLHFADGRVTAERFDAPPEAGEARTNTHDQILAALASGPRTVAELAAALGVAPDTIAKRLREALRAGEVVHVVATDRWQLVP